MLHPPGQGEEAGGRDWLAAPQVGVQQHRLLEVTHARHVDWPTVAERTRTARGVPARAQGRSTRHPRHDLTVHLDRDQRREDRYAAYEVSCAVDGIDDQARRPPLLPLPLLLPKEPELRVTLASQATSRPLDLAVGRGDGAAVGFLFHPQVAAPGEPQGYFVGAIDQLAEKRQPLKGSAQVPPPWEC